MHIFESKMIFVKVSDFEAIVKCSIASFNFRWPVERIRRCSEGWSKGLCFVAANLKRRWIQFQTFQRPTTQANCRRIAIFCRRHECIPDPYLRLRSVSYVDEILSSEAKDIIEVGIQGNRDRTTSTGVHDQQPPIKIYSAVHI